MTDNAPTDPFDDISQLVADLGRPVELPPASGEWIASHLAISRVIEICGVSRAEAVQAICRRAVIAVPVTSLTWAAGEDPHDYINRLDYFRENRRRNLHFSRVPDRKSLDEVLHFFDALGCPEQPDAPWDFDYASWQTGDFRVKLERDFSVVTLTVTGLRFDRVALEKAFGNADADSPSQFESVARKGGGRPLSLAWPNWVAELASFIHEDGFPAGSGSQGQEAVINAIADRLASKGLPSPTRSTVQPVVQAVLDRLRGAGS